MRALVRFAMPLSRLDRVGVRIVLCLALLGALPRVAAAKHVILSDSLLARAEVLEVKRGNHLGGINKWRFGEYAVLSSKQGWTRSTADTNFFRTKTENQSLSGFSFVLGSKTADTAFVNASHGITTRTNPGLSVGGGWTVGGDGGMAREWDLFTAAIAIDRDTTDAWTLWIGKTDVSDRHGESQGGGLAASLTRGERRIVLNPVFSRKLEERPSLTSGLKMQFSPPAMGYEFVEDSVSVCAVEYFSTGFGGSFKNTVWLRRDLDARMQLVLAAAMTAVLELECSALERPAQVDK